jgi:hypothetical protein
VPYEIVLEQEFQMVSGTAKVAGQTVKLQNAKLQANALTFELTADVQGTPIRHQFSGVVSGATIGGVADLAAPTLQSRTEWSATRAGPAMSAATGPNETLPSPFQAR